VTELVEVALFTDDVAAARAFYRDLVGADPIAEWAGAAIFSAGGAKILVHARGAAMTNGPPDEDHVALSVAALDDMCQSLQARGVEFLAGPRDYPWGRSAYLRDPDGRLVELAQT
jgi:catechol 2,3-dioxygenase-like lactoylglutathione lyase family enzyme